MFSNDRSPSESPVEPAEGLDFEKYFQILRKRIWLILGCLVVGALATTLHLKHAPRIYETEAILKVDAQQTRIGNLQNVFAEEGRGTEIATEKTREIEQLLKNRQFFLRAVEANKLDTDPRFKGPLSGSPEGVPQLAAELAGSLDVAFQKTSGFLVLTVSHRNPQLATDLANLFVNEVIRQNEESHGTFERNQLAKFQKQRQELQEKLKQSETRMQAYKGQSLILEGRQAAVSQSVKDISQKVSDAKYQRMRLEAELAESKKMGDDVQALLRISLVREDPKVVAIRASITQKEIEIGNIEQRYKEKHPKYIAAHDELKDLQQRLSSATLAAAQSIRIPYENAVANEKSLEKELDEQKTLAEKLGQESMPYDELVRSIETDRAMFDEVEKSIRAASVTASVIPDRIRVIQTAEVPEVPVSPQFSKTMAIGLLAGLAAGLALALGLDKLDSSFKTIDEVEQSLRLSVLAPVPHVKDLAADQPLAVVDNEAGSVAAESFRTLRTSMSLIDRAADRRVILFTSALAQEGKTFCALNYAVSLARQGLRTLVIDCDLRQPMVGRVLFPNEDIKAGVAECLQTPAITAAESVAQVKKPPVSALSFAELRNKHQGAKEGAADSPPPNWDAHGKTSRAEVLGQFARATRFENLHAIPGGRLVSNPSELLAQNGLTHLLTEALRRFDRVVLDSAPLCSVSDTQLLIPHAHAVCLVIRANKTPRKAVQRALELLNRGDTPLVGAIVNGLTAGQISHYGDSYHNYGYSRQQPAENPREATPS